MRWDVNLRENVTHDSREHSSPINNDDSIVSISKLEQDFVVVPTFICSGRTKWNLSWPEFWLKLLRAPITNTHALFLFHLINRNQWIGTTSNIYH